MVKSLVCLIKPGPPINGGSDKHQVYRLGFKTYAQIVKKVGNDLDF